MQMWLFTYHLYSSPSSNVCGKWQFFVSGKISVTSEPIICKTPITMSDNWEPIP